MVDGRDLAGLSRRGLTLFRRASVGFVFQFFNLVPSLTARENVLVAAELAGGKRGGRGGLARRGSGSRGSRTGSRRS